MAASESPTEANVTDRRSANYCGDISNAVQSARDHVICDERRGKFIYGHHPLYQHDLPIDAGLFDHRVRAALFKAKMRATILRGTKYRKLKKYVEWKRRHEKPESNSSSYNDRNCGCHSTIFHRLTTAEG